LYKKGPSASLAASWPGSCCGCATRNEVRIANPVSVTTTLGVRQLPRPWKLTTTAPSTIAVLENYQEADGSVIVPDVLRPYMDDLARIAAS